MNLFDKLPDLPQERRWRGQTWPVIGVSTILQRGPKFLLIRRKNPPYQGQWALVGGKIEFGETLAMAAEREVKEETGLDAVFVALRGIVNERLAPAGAEGVGGHFLLFVCALSAPDGEAQEQHEGQVAWFGRAQIDQLQGDGAIVPSDYEMWRRFAGATSAVPHFEVDIVAGRGQAQSTLVRFEEIT